MKVYRLALTEYCDTSGEGAKLFGGRWNLPGSPALYSGSSISASLLERLTIDPELFSSARYVLYSVMEIIIPNELIFLPAANELPKGWNRIPPLQATQIFGSELFKSGILCFAVPSVVDPTSTNYIINPLAIKFAILEFKVYPLDVDKRVLKG